MVLWLIVVITGLATEARSSFSCSGCTETLEADGRVYFLPFCGCVSVIFEHTEKLEVTPANSTSFIAVDVSSGKF
jgi:hypothetical protein